MKRTTAATAAALACAIISAAASAGASRAALSGGADVSCAALGGGAGASRADSVPVDAGEVVPTGREIIERVDANMYVESAVSEATMIVHGRAGTRTITSRAWRRGRDRSLVEYLSPPREQGKKMLRLGDKLWNYTPEPTDRIIAISGHLLRQSVMGSDLSYEDITENSTLTDRYDAVVTGAGEIDGRPCWIVDLTARTDDITYHSRRLWVDRERWLPLLEERFAKSGKMLKRIGIHEVFRTGGRWYPKRMTFKDTLASGEGTDYIVDSIDFDAEVPEHLLTKAALRR